VSLGSVCFAEIADQFLLVLFGQPYLQLWSAVRRHTPGECVFRGRFHHHDDGRMAGLQQVLDLIPECVVDP